MSLSLTLEDNELKTAGNVLISEAREFQSQFELAVQTLRQLIECGGDSGAKVFDGQAARNILQFSEQVRNIIADRIKTLGQGLGRDLDVFVQEVDQADKSIS